MSTTLTTDWFRQHYFGIDWSVPKRVGVLCFTRNPVFNDASAAVFAGVTTVDSLTSRGEWVPIHSSANPTKSGVASNIYAYRFDNGSIRGLQLVNADSTSANVDTPSSPTGWTFTPNPPDQSVQEVVTSVAFFLIDADGTTYGGGINPVMFVTTQGVGEDTVIHEGAILGQFHLASVTGGNARIVTVDETTIPPSFDAAYVILLPALPTWEGAHAQHLWLEPQRTNFIANPSFEDVSLFGWRWESPSPVVAERVLGGVDRTGQRPFCGHFVPEDGTLTLESNNFPVVGGWYSFSFHLSARALDTSKAVSISYGLVCFNPAYTMSTFLSSDQNPQHRVTAVAFVPSNITFTVTPAHTMLVDELVSIEGVDGVGDGSYRINATTPNTLTVDSLTTNTALEVPISGFATGHKKVYLADGTENSGFLHLKGLYQVDEDTIPEICFHLEVTNCATFWIDNVLVDPHEGQYDYFDGNSTDSFPEDYRWMGGRENRHFSLWYNNYKNTHNRLFSDWDVNEQVYKSGLVEEWAPTGSNIVDHWDAVTSFTPLNWNGPAFYPLHEGTNLILADVPPPPPPPPPLTTAVWDDPVFAWDDPEALWDSSE